MSDKTSQLKVDKKIKPRPFNQQKKMSSEKLLEDLRDLFQSNWNLQKISLFIQLIIDV